MKKIIFELKEKQRLFLELSSLAMASDPTLAEELRKQACSFKEEAVRLANETVY